MTNTAVQRLSLREKIGQTCQIHGKNIADLSPDQLASYFQKNPVGSIFLGSEIIGSPEGKAEKLQHLIQDCQRISPLPLSVAGDLENGAGGAIRGLTAFPNLLALGAVNDLGAAYDYGRLTAVEARRVGFNWTFGPVVDLALNWLNPIVSVRSLGQSAERVAEMAAAMIKGYQEHGLSATAKHFPGDGVDFRDQHFCVSVNSMSESEWFDTFGAVYTACFQAGVHAVMAGHVALPWLEHQRATGRAPLPASTSRCILEDLLRERLGFDGVIVSDALIMAGFRGKSARREDLIIEAFNAGIDVMLWPGDDYFDVMERAVARGAIPEKRLDQSVRRVLELKVRQGLFHAPDATAKAAAPVEVHTVRPDKQAVEFAHTLAERSLTLVRNEAGLLPLDPARVRRVQILLATPREKGASDRLRPLLESLAARGIFADLHVNGNCLDLRRKEIAGERYDALFALFELSTHALKNSMRPAGDMAECLWTIQGLETMRPIVVSLGSPYLIYDMPWVETYLNAYSNNEHSLAAVERALFGDILCEGLSPIPLQEPWSVMEGYRPIPEPVLSE